MRAAVDECKSPATELRARVPKGVAPAAFLRLVTGLRTRLGQAHLPLTSLAQEVAALGASDGAIRWSPPLEGVTTDPAATFRRLMARHVEHHLKAKPARISRTDAEIDAVLVRALERRGALRARLQPRTLTSPVHHFELSFEHSWKNGVWNCVQSLSFDMQETREIQTKALEWVGTARVLSPSQQGAQLVLFVGLPGRQRPDAREAALDALAALTEQVTGEASVFREDEADALAERVERDLSHAAE